MYKAVVLVNVHATILHRTSRVLVNGMHLKKEEVVITDCLDEAKNFPEFALINEIFIMRSSKILLGLMKLHTELNTRGRMLCERLITE